MKRFYLFTLSPLGFDACVFNNLKDAEKAQAAYIEADSVVQIRYFDPKNLNKQKAGFLRSYKHHV